MDNDSTRNGGLLSLQERAARGLLSLQENSELLSLQERAARDLLPSEPELSLDDIVNLEHPGDLAARNALSRAIHAAIDYKDLPAVYVPLENEPGAMLVRFNSGDWLIDRESYRQWRAQCPKSLLSELTQIRLWLGATPALAATPPLESIPHEAVAKPEKRQRNDAMSNAIQAAIAVLSPSGGALPRPADLFDYLAHNDATKTITGIAKGNRALHWIDDNGNEQTMPFSALTKRLNRIRQGD